MTQQYLVGELSLLVAGLQPSAGGPAGQAVRCLRREVECSQRQALPTLAARALDLADQICQADLAHSDADRFCRSLDAAIALREFGIDARLVI